MRYSLLGRSGLRVSNLCLGTMTFGEGVDWSRDARTSRAVFDAYVEAGGNFIDTANLYMGGESERLVGEFVAADRDRFVIATKYTNAAPRPGDPNAAGNHRKSLVRSLDASLRRMKLDHIDLYLVHFWDFTVRAEEVQRALDDAVRAGKILHVGLSDVPAWVVSRAQAFAELRGWAPVACMQLEYSLLERSIEREHLPLARAADIAVMAWAPLAGGILTGKYTGDTKPEGPVRRDSMRAQALDDRARTIAQAVRTAADRIGISPAQLSLAWLLAKGVIPIVGATGAAQMRDNLASADIALDAETLAGLDAASAFDLGHPYVMLTQKLAMRLAYGGMRDQIEIPNFPGGGR